VENKQTLKGEPLQIINISVFLARQSYMYSKRFHFNLYSPPSRYALVKLYA